MGSREWLRLTGACLSVLVLAAAAQGQEAVGEGAKLDTRSFLFTRYASRSAAALYAGLGFGRAGIFFGMVDNPRSGYRELLVGAMTRVARPGASLLVGLAAADASDADYLQLYLVPSLSRGRWSADVTFEWYEPLDAEGIEQLEIDPAVLSWQLSPRFALGAAYVGDLPLHGESHQRAGPTVTCELPRATLQLHWLEGVHRAKDEWRVSLQASF